MQLPNVEVTAIAVTAGEPSVSCECFWRTRDAVPGRSAHDGKYVRENDLPAPTDDKVGESDRPTI